MPAGLAHWGAHLQQCCRVLLPRCLTPERTCSYCKSTHDCWQSLARLLHVVLIDHCIALGQVVDRLRGWVRLSCAPGGNFSSRFQYYNNNNNKDGTFGMFATAVSTFVKPCRTGGQSMTIAKSRWWPNPRTLAARSSLRS